jgi:hypothetical protein
MASARRRVKGSGGWSARPGRSVGHGSISSAGLVILPLEAVHTTDSAGLTGRTFARCMGNEIPTTGSTGTVARCSIPSHRATSSAKVCRRPDQAGSPRPATSQA